MSFWHYEPLVQKAAAVAQQVEHVLGKDGVIGSIPISSSTKYLIRSDPKNCNNGSGCVKKSRKDLGEV